MAERGHELFEVAARELRLSNPDKVYFPESGWPRATSRGTTLADSLLPLADQDEEEGLGDAPWPPHFAKQPGEPKRVQPSRAKKS